MQSQVARQAVELGVRDGLVAVDQGDPVRVAFENGLEFLRERLVSPISSLTIALRELRRKRNDPFQHWLSLSGSGCSCKSPVDDDDFASDEAVAHDQVYYDLGNILGRRDAAQW